jgi:hypothetical protein
MPVERASRALGVLSLVFTAALGVGGAPALAWAGPDPAKLKAASESFALGAAAYDAGKFAEAAPHFEAADASAPSPKALRLAIRSREQAGQLAKAATLAALALDRHPDDADLTKVAKAAIEAAQSKTYKVAVSCASPCLLAAGDKIVHGEARTRWTLFLDPGPSTIGASFLGNVAATDQSVVAVAGKSTSIRFEPKADKPPSDRPPSDKPPSDKPPSDKPPSDKPPSDEPGDTTLGGDPTPDEPQGTWRIHPAGFIVGLVVTAGLGGTTIWSGIDTVNDPGTDRVREECAGLGEECPLYKDAQSKELRTNALIGATAGAAAITVVLAIVTDWGGSAEAADDDPKMSEAVSFSLPRFWLDVQNSGRSGVAAGDATAAPRVNVMLEVGGQFQ